MTEWLKINGVSIVIAVATLVSTYAVYGYRLQSLEDRVNRQGTVIQSLQTDNTETLVALAKIQTDLSYIKAQIDKITP